MQAREPVVALETVISRILQQTLPGTTVLHIQAIEENRAVLYGSRRFGPEPTIEHRLEIKPLAEN